MRLVFSKAPWRWCCVAGLSISRIKESGSANLEKSQRQENEQDGSFKISKLLLKGRKSTRHVSSLELRVLFLTRHPTGVLAYVGTRILVIVLVAVAKFLTPRWWSRKTCAHLLLRELQNDNLLLNNHWQEMLDPTKKKIPHIQRQGRSPSKMGGEVKSHLESNPMPTRDAQRAQTNIVRTRTQRPHRDGARTVFECLLQRWGAAVACHRGRGSGCSRPGYGITLLEEVAINPP